MKIKPICINLLNSKDRRTNAKNILSELFDEFYLFNAVEGNEINILKTQNPNIKLIEYRNNYILHDKSKPIIASSASRRTSDLCYGEFGCALSHYILYRHLIKDDNYDAYLIFEDDIVFNMDHKTEFINSLKNIPANTDVIYYHDYDFNKWFKITNIDNHYAEISDGIYMAENRAYLITKQGANKILKHMKGFINFTGDDLIRLMFQDKLLKVIISRIRFFSRLQIKSDIWNIWKEDERPEQTKWDKPYVKYNGTYDLLDIERLNKITPQNQKKFITMTNIGRGARLGNQMFQYVLLKYMANKYNLNIRIPIIKSNDIYNNFRLDEAFDINFIPLLNPDLVDIKIIEKQFEYDREIEFTHMDQNVDKNIDITGYFQNIHYFNKIKDQILKDFRFKTNINNTCENIVNNIKNTKPNHKLVAIHIRRGDYLHHNPISEPITKEYILNGLHVIRSKHEHIVPILFTDDKEYTRNLNIPDAIMFDLTDIEDMCLMSKCDHFIISASSFSLWGVLLADKENKIVVTPTPWFNKNNDNVKNNRLHDLIPEEWIRLVR